MINSAQYTCFDKEWWLRRFSSYVLHEYRKMRNDPVYKKECVNYFRNIQDKDLDQFLQEAAAKANVDIPKIATRELVKLAIDIGSDHLEELCLAIGNVAHSIDSEELLKKDFSFIMKDPRVHALESKLNKLQIYDPGYLSKEYQLCVNQNL